jgi:hypothetical protein
MKSLALLMTLSLLSAGNVADNTPTTLDGSTVEEMKTLVSKMTPEKLDSCVKAFGNTDFCGCIETNLPVGISFRRYIEVATSSDDELGNKNHSKEDQEMLEQILDVRDKCVQEAFSR